MKPVMTLFAGTNGSGKSTLTASMKDSVGFVIDPDRIARERNMSSYLAGKEVIKLVNTCIEEKINFSLETTLSGNLPFAQINRAKENGFTVAVHYVGLDSLDLHKERVQARVRKGGHHIPDEDIERRYERSLINLTKVIPQVDYCYIYDNSVELCLYCFIENGGVKELLDGCPEWIIKRLPTTLGGLQSSSVFKSP